MRALTYICRLAPPTGNLRTMPPVIQSYSIEGWSWSIYRHYHTGNHNNDN